MNGEVFNPDCGCTGFGSCVSFEAYFDGLGFLATGILSNYFLVMTLGLGRLKQLRILALEDQLFLSEV